MALKQIPQEILLPESKFVKRKSKKTQHPVHKKMLQQQFEKDSRIIQKAYTELAKFLQQEAKYGLKELSELSHHLQYALLSLQRKKHRVFKKKNKKA